MDLDRAESDAVGETEMSDVSPYLVSPYLQRPLRSDEQAFRELQAKRHRRAPPKRPVASRGEAEAGVRRRIARAEGGRS